MRITCSCIDDFIENLQDESDVLQGTIRINRTKVIEEEGLRERIKLQASAVCFVGESGEYILEAGEEMGVDKLDGEPELGGTEKRDEAIARLQKVCDSKGWKMKPGIIDY